MTASEWLAIIAAVAGAVASVGGGATAFAWKVWNSWQTFQREEAAAARTALAESEVRRFAAEQAQREHAERSAIRITEERAAERELRHRQGQQLQVVVDSLDRLATSQAREEERTGMLVEKLDTIARLLKGRLDTIEDQPAEAFDPDESAKRRRITR